MNHIHLRQAQKEDFETISKLIISQNKNPERHCIQSDISPKVEDIYQEMLRLDSTSEICFVLSHQEDQIIGALGSEFDEESGRGWLRGPFVLPNTDDWDGVASALMAELLAQIPSTIYRFDSFLNIANEQGNRFYLNQGFQHIRQVHVYEATAPKTSLDVPSPCETLKPEQEPSLISLHDTLFPQTYITGQQMVAKVDEANQVFVYANKDDVLGYVYAMIEEESPEGEVDFIGVRADAREQGIGRQLLLTALQWFFEVKKISQVFLTVNDELTNARSLYESVGFVLKYTGVNTRKDR